MSYMNVEKANQEIREHFKEWLYMFDNPLGLCAFAYYEGCGSRECCREILERCTPVVLYGALVERANFEVISNSENWILYHKKIGEICYSEIKKGKWYFDEDKIGESIDKLSDGEICAYSFEKLYEATR